LYSRNAVQLNITGYFNYRWGGVIAKQQSTGLAGEALHLISSIAKAKQKVNHLSMNELRTT
jgi:hypothetical protein